MLSLRPVSTSKGDVMNPGANTPTHIKARLSRLWKHGNSLETLRNMVASGLGVTLLPASAACGPYANPLVRCIPFEAPAPSRRIVLAWRKRTVREQAIAAVATAVRQVAAPWMRVIPPSV